MKYKIIKNFLDNDTLKSLQQRLLSHEFAWFYRPRQVEDEDREFSDYFCHSFFQSVTINSDYWNLVIPLITKLNVKALIEIRANLVIQRPKKIISGFHTDNDYDCKTAIFYINTCNGYTLFENGEKVKCKENKIVIFDTNLKHAAASQTDTQQRVVLNINYF